MMLLSQAATILNTSWKGETDLPFMRVITDSRAIRPGDLFVALRGENFDGHDFIDQAFSQGAAGVLINQTVKKLPKGPFIMVEDTIAALGQLAAAWRNQMAVKVCAITGSSGKTTVKEMTAAILRHAFGEEAVLATAGNFNNHIGLPLTLLTLKSVHRFAVIEMGMNHFGEIRYLTHLAKPDVALINNAQGAHLEFLGSVEGVAKAKAEIFEGLSDKGVALIPVDDEFTPLWQQKTQGFTQRSFGINGGEVSAEAIELDTLGSRWVLKAANKKSTISLSVPGLHNVHNALAAAAIALVFDVELDQIAQGLAQFIPYKGRLQQKRAYNGAALIDDTYNANPSSMKAAIDVLEKFSGVRLLILGDMGEVGSQAEEMHRLIGQYAAEKGIEQLLAFGENMRFAVEAFNAISKGVAECFTSMDKVIERAFEMSKESAAILVKGSRSMRMERVVAALEINDKS